MREDYLLSMLLLIIFKSMIVCKSHGFFIEEILKNPVSQIEKSEETSV